MPGQTLAQMVRAKYPGTYDDMTDQQLEAKIDQKYPGVYSDVPHTQAAQPAPQDYRTMLGSPEALRGMADPLVGALKGAANTVIGLGQAAAQVPGIKQLSQLAGGPNAAQSFNAARAAVQPTNAAQQVGYGAEQMGEFFGLPEAKGLTIGGRVPAIVSRAVQSGAANAALAAAQGADARGVALSGLPTAAGPFLGKAAAALDTGNALDKNAAQMERALAPTTNENKVRAARVAPQMVQRGVYARDLPALEAMASHKSDVAGRAVGAAVSGVADQQRDVQPLIDSLEQVKSQSGAIDHLPDGRQIVIQPEQVAAIDKLQNTLKQYGDQISIRSLNNVRQKWDEVVQAGKGFTNPDVGWSTWAAREGRSVLRDELSQAHPDIDKVMHEYSFWQNIEDVAHATNRRRVGQNGSLLPTMAAGAGAVVGDLALTGGAGTAAKLGAAAVGGKIAANLKRLLDSPGYQMWSAVQKQRLADALASGDLDRIGSAVGRGMAATSSMELRPSH